jgi:hypothetical protein
MPLEITIQQLLGIVIIAVLTLATFLFVTGGLQGIQETWKKLLGILESPDRDYMIARESFNALAETLNAACADDKAFSKEYNYGIKAAYVDGPDGGYEITNFRLPQDTGKLAGWIPGYGDPRFMIYYEKFPEGQDEPWSKWAAINFILTVVPIGKLGQVTKLVGSGAFKLVGVGGRIVNAMSLGVAGKFAKLIKGPVKVLIIRPAKQIGGEVIDWSGTIIEKMGQRAYLLLLRKIQTTGPIEVTTSGGKKLIFLAEDLPSGKIVEIGAAEIKYSIKLLDKIVKMEFGDGRIVSLSQPLSAAWVRFAELDGRLSKEGAEYILEEIAKGRTLTYITTTEGEKAIVDGLSKEILEKLSKKGWAGLSPSEEQIAKAALESIEPIGGAKLTADEIKLINNHIGESLQGRITYITPRLFLVSTVVTTTQETLSDKFGPCNGNPCPYTLIFEYEGKIKEKRELTDCKAKGINQVRVVTFLVNDEAYMVSPCAVTDKPLLIKKYNKCKEASVLNIGVLCGIDPTCDREEPCITIDPQWDKQADLDTYCFGASGQKLGPFPWPCHPPGVLGLCKI